MATNMKANEGLERISKKDLTSGAGGGILIDVDKNNNISSPIEQGRTDGVGEPWAILNYDKPLNDRQQAVLDKLPEYDSRAWFDKNVTMMDLSALTAKTGNEFAMFTLGSRRLIVRGNAGIVNITPEKAAEMSALGYRWSGHTHIGSLLASIGDKRVLNAFKNQKTSVIYNEEGKKSRFFKT